MSREPIEDNIDAADERSAAAVRRDADRHHNRADFQRYSNAGTRNPDVIAKNEKAADQIEQTGVSKSLFKKRR